MKLSDMQEPDMKAASILMAMGLVLAAPVLHPEGGMALACPPGLAKKDPPCIPPGQARRGGGDDHVVHGGRYADRDDLIYLDDYPRYGLPGLPYGQRYAVVDDQIVVIDAETYEVLQLIRLFSALAN
jgi:hypothetical protein